RKSSHQLTQWGRAQSAQATPRIYGLTDVQTPAVLAICNTPTADMTARQSEAWITSNIVITTDPSAYADAFCARLRPDDLPHWMREKTIRRATQDQTTALLR
ncbi:MAG: hypothetical protein ABJ327_15895, partial [Litoreibacter sp.]